MPNETCILTTKDFTILEAMHDRYLGWGDLLVPVLNRKIESAVVVFRDDLPENVATLNSRVTFTVNGRDRDTRVISHDRMTSPISMFLPITTLRGLVLLGLSEGQEFVVTNIDGAEERITLERVHYQPEAARRKEAIKRETAAQQQTPLLEVIRRTFHEQPPLVPIAPNDPSPSAAPQPSRMMSVATLVATGIGKWFQATLMMLAATIGAFIGTLMPRSRSRRHRQGLCHRNRRNDGRRSDNKAVRGPEFSRERPDASPGCHWIS